MFRIRHYVSGTASSSDQKRWQNRAGFTVVELILVIAIVGIIAVMAVLKLPSIQTHRDRSAAEELMMHLRYAQNLAMNRERTTRVEFDVASHSYSVFIADAGGFVPAKDPVTQTDWVVNISERFSGVELSSVNINGGNELRFSETNGIPCDVSGAPIASDGTITFRSGLKVVITPETGYVSIQ